MDSRVTGIPQRIDDYPDDKYLNEYVREKVCAASTNKWRDLGIVLMGQDAVSGLDVIRINHPNNVEECCSRMFTKWRQRNPKATWKQLIEALKQVKLTHLASELGELLMSSKECCVEQHSKMSPNSNHHQLEKHQLNLGVTELDKCKDDLKHFYRKKMNLNQKKYSKWPKLGDPTLYINVAISRGNFFHKRYCESHAVSQNEREYDFYLTVDKLLKDGYGKVILIEGDPGAGKTTLTFQICKEWAEDKLLVNDILFWIPLRHYNSVTTPSELFHKLGYPEMTDYVQKTNGKGLALILDGWDEMPNHLQTDSLFHDMIFSTIRTFTHSTIIVTSRPTCSSEIAEIVKTTNSYYQLLGFDRERAVTYIKAYFHNDPSSAELLLTFLYNNEYLCQHFYIPISVAIMCFVHYSDGKQIPQTLSRLYERFVVLCLRSNIPDACLQDLAKFKTIHNMPERIRSLFHKLCKIAFDMLKENKLVLHEEDLEFMQDDIDNLQLKQFDGFGLLHVDHYISELATVEISYSFIHRSVQELLAAIFILDTGNISDVLEAYFYEGSYLINIFPFLFGLVSKELLKPLAGKLIQILNKSDRNHKLLSSILYCLFEAHDETLCHEFGQIFSEKKDIKIKLGWRALLDCHYACYFIAFCGAMKLNVYMTCNTFGISSESYCEILYKYLQDTSTDIALFHFTVHITSVFSHKGMIQFAKALSAQHNILSVELGNIICDPDCVTILCDSICKYNPQITNLRLPVGELSENDLESIESLLTTCLSLESLHMDCSTDQRVHLNLSQFFCKALCETKSLRKLLLPQWRLSQANSEVLGSFISQNCTLKEFCVNVATADCIGPILNGLSSNTSITTFNGWPHCTMISTSNTLGQYLEKYFTLNHSLSIIDFTNVSFKLQNLICDISPKPPLHIPWSSTQVISICTGLCANTTVVTLDISGCYIDTEACRAICGMLSQNTTLQHLFLNPKHLEKQEVIIIIDGCRANATLELLSLIHWCPFVFVHAFSFEFSHDPEIIHVLQQIRKLRQEKDKPLLNVYWECNKEYEKVREQVFFLMWQD